MKRAVSLLLSAALLLGLMSACRESGPLQDEHTARELADAAFLASGCDETMPVEYLTQEEGGEELLTAYLENAYGLQDSWVDAVVIRATGASAFEIAVLRMADSESAVQTAAVLMSYTFTRQGDFTGYAPAEADMVARSGILQDGSLVALFICPDTDGARAAVEAVLSGGSRPGPVGGGTVTDVKELRDLVVSDRGMDAADLERLDDGDPDALNAYMKDVYGLRPDHWVECAIARGTGDSAFEVAVVRVANVNDYWDVTEPLDNYLDSREGTYENYADQAEMLHQALTIFSTPYVVLLACQDAEQTAQVFAKATGNGGYSYSVRHPTWEMEDPSYPGRSKFTAPNKDDMSLYDTSAICTAWEQDDPSSLSKEDKKIYSQAQKVLKKLLKDDMNDYEKEVAIYSWVVQNVDYDWTHQDRMKVTPRESFTPYGGLVNHRAVCLGYATTFQLLMDLAGVECITVPGAAFSSQEDHGWNMVRLNGEWYCVDVTWDANAREQAGQGRQEDWNYFNVTSDYMASSDHQWDYANTPEATAVDQGQS